MTVLELLPESARMVGTSFPAFVERAGTNFPVAVLLFDAATDEKCSWTFKAVGYTSGNLTVKIQWYGDSATSGDVVWAAQISAITPNTDTQDVEIDGLAAVQTVTDTHLGTTAKRIHEATLTISNLDSLAAGDIVHLVFFRDADNVADTMTGDAALHSITVEYA